MLLTMLSLGDGASSCGAAAALDAGEHRRPLALAREQIGARDVGQRLVQLEIAVRR
jgi:hypothetical protein